MTRKVNKNQTSTLLQDIVHSRHDLLSLAEQHRMDPAELAKWIAKPTNQKVLSGLCTLADFQTQILLSRYRSLAASRLIKLATDPENPEDGAKSNDLARKACVDLIRLNLPRADLDSFSGDSNESPQAHINSIRKLLYSSTDLADADQDEQSSDNRS